MKCFWRRIVAFTLILCITLSLLPPVVLATEGSQTPNQTPAGNDRMVYDFGMGVNGETFGDAATPFAGRNLSDTKKVENPIALPINIETNANKRLESGPAKAVNAMSRFGFAKYLESTGTGLAHPIPINKTISAPIGSR